MKTLFFVLAIGGLATMNSCSDGNASAAERRKLQEVARQATIDSLQVEMAKRDVIDSMNEVARVQQEEMQKEAAVKKEVVVVQAPANRRAPRRSTSSAVAPAPAQPVYVAAEPEEQKKKGWSAKAKGAVIGTAVGAGSGAIINKRNRGAGAVIGGIGGAILGTGAGAVIDKKNGR